MDGAERENATLKSLICYLKSVLDDFGSEVGSTLTDLASDWENQNHSIVNGSDKDMDNIATRFAKPLCFANPVFDLVHKNSVQATIKRPTLIPLSQLNGGNVIKDDGKYQKAKPGHKKKNQHSYGILSKISGVARRTSHTKPNVEPDVSHSQHPVPSSRKSSQTSIGEVVVSTNEKKRNSTQGDKSPQIRISDAEHRASNASSVDENLSSSAPETLRTDSQVIANSSDTTVSDSNKDEILQKEVAPSLPIPHPRLKSQTSPIKNVESNQSDLSCLTVSPKQTHLVTSPESTASFGSVQSLESVLSDDASDTDIKTMADVITEVSVEGTDLTSPVKQNNEDSEEANDARVFVETPGRIRRNKTLRWTGTRNAPVLIREFTRKQKQKKVVEPTDTVGADMDDNAETRTSEQETKNKSTDSQSTTPSQQVANFGSKDDEDISDGASNDADMSSSDNSADASLVHREQRVRIRNRNKLTEPPKESLNRDSAFIVLSSLLPPAPKLRRTQSSKVRAYLQKLGNNVNNALGYAVTHFVGQTIKNNEKRPLVLLHDIRSFLTDIKRYLISNPHIGLVKKIQRMVNKTASMTEIDGAIDDSLDRLILYPLHDMVYRCLVLDYTKSGQLTLMQEAIRLAKKKTPKELGIRDTLIPPDHDTLEVIKGHFTQLQRTYSPYFKLKELLAAVMKIYQNTKDLKTEDLSASKIGADDFLPLLVYSIVQCEFVAADIETQYIDGLLEPSLLLGEGGYYLTTLISAIQVVLSIKRKESALPNIADLQGFLKVGISPSEPTPSLGNPADEVTFHKTLHVPPAMTCKNLCQMIVKKFHVAVPENYCLHVVVKGVPHPLEPNECPQLVKMDLLSQYPASSFYFSFQRRRDVEVDQTAPASVSTIRQTGDLLVAITGEEETEHPVAESDVAVDHCEVKEQEGAPDKEDNPTVFSDELQQITESEDPLLTFVKENEKPLVFDKDPAAESTDEHRIPSESRPTQLDISEDHSELKLRSGKVPEIHLTPSHGSVFDNLSNSNSVDDLFPDTSPSKRMSCLIQNSVASLTEFFEAQTSPGHSPSPVYFPSPGHSPSSGHSLSPGHSPIVECEQEADE